MTTGTACEAEIVELHAFFEGWFRGELPATGEAFARFEGVLDPGFEMIGPDGARRGRDEVLSMVRDGHGADPGMRIRIDDVRHRFTRGEVSVVTYLEIQDRGGTTRTRISTATFRPDPTAPHGLAWLHVHETWR